MSGLDGFEPTLAAAHACIAGIRLQEYPRTRNVLEGAVSRLSPYVTHGFVTLPEIVGLLSRSSPIPVQHKFVYELGWREYFRHVWQHRGDGILESLHEGLLPDHSYTRDMALDIREARTGVPAIDHAVRTLYATGYLHNHARMWLASYVVHLRKIHWRTGADWMLGHLLDGDLASNHLSWQWVAGTASRKPYLFNAENVARYAPVSWHSPGSVIDRSYEQLDAVARDPDTVLVAASGDGVPEPAVLHRPPHLQGFFTPDPASVADRDVWLVHPWALRAPPAGLAADTLLVGVFPSEFHDQWAWNAARWEFATRRMREVAPWLWIADVPTIAQVLSRARSVHGYAEAHVEAWLPKVADCVPVTRLFANVAEPAGSFSQWWKGATGQAAWVADLPGLRAGRQS